MKNVSPTGREGPEHVILLDEEIGCSKVHAAIEFKDMKYFIKDGGR